MLYPGSLCAECAGRKGRAVGGGCYPLTVEQSCYVLLNDSLENVGWNGLFRLLLSSCLIFFVYELCYCFFAVLLSGAQRRENNEQKANNRALELVSGRIC